MEDSLDLALRAWEWTDWGHKLLTQDTVWALEG